MRPQIDGGSGLRKQAGQNPAYRLSALQTETNDKAAVLKIAALSGFTVYFSEGVFSLRLFMLILELIGTVSFAVSGTLTAYGKRMDIFGVALLGLTTAVGGGVIRDVLLGSLPPAVFQNPIYAAVAVGVSLAMFIALRYRALSHNYRLFERALFISDTIGLGIFTVLGVKAAFLSGSQNLLLAIFVGPVTGVGGGVLRDVLADDTPYIFVKHVYACAAIAGALVCALLWPVNDTVAMFAGMAVIIAIRILAAHFRWSLQKATGILPAAGEPLRKKTKKDLTEPPKTGMIKKTEDGQFEKAGQPNR